MRFVNKTAGSHFANRFCVEVFARNVYTEWSFSAKPQVRFWEIKSVSTFWPLVDVLAQNLNTDRTSAGNVHIEPASPPPPRSPAFFAIQDSCNLRRAVAEGRKRMSQTCKPLDLLRRATRKQLELVKDRPKRMGSRKNADFAHPADPFRAPRDQGCLVFCSPDPFGAPRDRRPRPAGVSDPFGAPRDQGCLVFCSPDPFGAPRDRRPRPAGVSDPFRAPRDQGPRPAGVWPRRRGLQASRHGAKRPLQGSPHRFCSFRRCYVKLLDLRTPRLKREPCRNGKTRRRI